MFSNNISFPSSRNVSDQVSHPYKTIGKTIVLCILIFKYRLDDYGLLMGKYLKAGDFAFFKDTNLKFS